LFVCEFDYLSPIGDPDFCTSYIQVETIIGKNDEAIMNFEKVNGQV
jgi:hypothetical protein